MSITRFAAALVLVSAALPARAADPAEWKLDKAAKYLDDRQQAWYDYSPAQQPQATLCMSCHTTLAYAIARPAVASIEPDTFKDRMKVMYDSVEKRVERWEQITSIYSSQEKNARGTEAVLNALILVTRDASQPTPALSPAAKKAFQILWDTQTKGADDPAAGSWAWLDFEDGGVRKYQPWEFKGARFYGAALAAVAVGRASKFHTFQSDDEKKGIERLRAYLRGTDGQAGAYNQAYLLWAATEFDGLLTEAERKPLVAALVARQKPDGGWNVAELLKLEKRTIGGEPTDTASDGYATGLVVYALVRAGEKDNPAVKKGLAWLADPAHRGPDGQWQASSLNRVRKPGPMPSAFMDDAATGFAVLALTAK